MSEYIYVLSGLADGGSDGPDKVVFDHKEAEALAPEYIDVFIHETGEKAAAWMRLNDGTYTKDF